MNDNMIKAMIIMQYLDLIDRSEQTLELLREGLYDFVFEDDICEECEIAEVDTERPIVSDFTLN